MTKNTATTPAAQPTTPRMPNVKTADARLRKAGIEHDGTPAGRKAAWVRLHTEGPATPATPATQPKATRPAAKPATQPSNFPLCGCGCGVPTVTAKALFLSGHDARLAGVLGRAMAEGHLTEAQQAQFDRLSDRLKVKVEGVRQTATRKAALKAAREEAAKAAKAAYDQIMAQAR